LKRTDSAGRAGPALRLLLGSGALLVAACSAKPVEPAAGDARAVLVSPGDGGARDLRAPYRMAVCVRLPPGSPSCDDVLLRLPDEAPAPPAVSTGDLATRYRIAFVPGFFSECFEGFARPFADVAKNLRRAGFEVDHLQVSGRGTARGNAASLARHFAALDPAARPTIVVAHSKGLIDVLELAASHPLVARRVAAIVGVAGAFNGSPLADDLNRFYRSWLAAFPLPRCQRGTGEEIDELRPEVRAAWWQRHGPAIAVPVFSLVAAPRPDQVSPLLRVPYRHLAQIDPRNDGQLLARDQVVPGGSLLGYANADHLAVAVPLRHELPALAFLFQDRVPRTALIEGAIEVIAATAGREASCPKSARRPAPADTGPRPAGRRDHSG
jgi:hypothetical protein